MHATLLNGLDERRLRYLFAAFFLALAIPAAALIAQAYSQLKWEAFRSNQQLAEDLAARVDGDLRVGVAAEERRSFGDYSFLVVEGDAAANFVQRSPLSAFPVAGAVPGVLGYFQVDAAGELSTPLLPETGVDAATYGIGAEEERARLALLDTIRNVLAENRLVQRAVRDEPARVGLSSAAEVSAFADAAGASASNAAPAALPPGMVPEPPQAAFDRLATNRQIEQRTLANAAEPAAATGATLPAATPAPREPAAQERPSQGLIERQKRTEQSFVPEREVATVDERDLTANAAKLEFRVRTFESELDPLEIGVLDTGHFVLFRNVWRDAQRYVQGALIDRAAFLAAVVETPFHASSLAGVTDLSVVYQGNALSTLSAAAKREYSSPPPELVGSLLHRARLSPPFGDFELVFSVQQLPRGAGSLLLAWVSLTLAAVLCGGFFFMYRFAVGQMRLARQQQDFVSAVSHELKTPLTSIRMYGEMLKAGWADEAKKRTYYDYIHSESERLSRLIENVLQLARLTRSSQRFDLKRVTVAELMDMVRSKVSTQIELAGFEFEVRNEAPADADLVIDGDCFAQIVINLVDNALKFSAAAQHKRIEFVSRRESDGRLLFTVRDFGPGVPKAQMKRIFELFYRPENELTRETAGTGIGLALVQQLTTAMGGRVDVRNCEPGAEFRLGFPRSV